MAVSDSVLIAQLSDTHVQAGSFDPDLDNHADLVNDDRVAAAVESLRVEDPAPWAVLLTGDLADDQQPAQYRRLLELLEPLEAPLLALPGNHDDRDLLRSAFPTTPWIDADHASWVADIGGVRIVGLDSVKPGEHGGQIDEARAAWLADALATPHAGATLLAMHHPPFATGIDWMERDGFDGLDTLVDVVAQAGNVDQILCGHMHRPVASTVAGVPARVGISTARHVALDLAHGSNPSMIDDPIGYQLHLVTGRQVVTHTRYVATGAEPFVPDWADTF